MKLPHVPRSVLVVLALTAMTVVTSFQLSNVRLVEESVRESISMDEWEWIWAYESCALVFALGALPGGYLAQRFGPRRVIAVSIVGGTVFGSLIACSLDIFSFFVAYLVFGLSFAATVPAAVLLLSRWVPERHRGLANGVVLAGGSIGYVVAKALTLLLSLAFARELAPTFGYLTGDAAWRPTLLSYAVVCGVLGIGVWRLLRGPCAQDLPAALDGATAVGGRGAPTAVPWLALLTSRNQWLFCGTLFFSGYGWILLFSGMSTTLVQRFDVPFDPGVLRSNLANVSVVIGVVALLAGGILTDWLTPRYGRRWGRTLPIGMMKLPCVAMLLASPWLPEVWMAVVALVMVTFCFDLGVPAVWAFAQDTGGEHAGVVIGWGLLWLGLGYAVPSIAMGVMASNFGQDFQVYSGASALAVAAVCGLLINADVRLDDKPTELEE